MDEQSSPVWSECPNCGVDKGMIELFERTETAYGVTVRAIVQNCRACGKCEQARIVVR